MASEVSIDDAISSKLSLDEDMTAALDKLITESKLELPDEDDVPIDVVLMSQIVHNKLADEIKNLSLVEVFKYLMKTLEKLLGGQSQIDDKTEADIDSCSEDLAASHYRLRNHIKDGKVRDAKQYLELLESQKTEYLESLLQIQTDKSYCYASLQRCQEFRESVMKEIELLLKLENIEKAINKIRRYNLVVDGMKIMLHSPVNKSLKLEKFEQSGTVRKQLWEEYLDILDDETITRDDLEDDRGRANIIVSTTIDKGFKNGKFYVNDLESGLKLAQNKGGNIFLEQGIYKAGSFFDIKQRNRDCEIEIIGVSTATVSIQGTIKVESDNKVIFRHVKLEIGQSPECNDAVFVTKGCVELRECLVEVTVNTALYVMGGAELVLAMCVLDGLESCQRAVSVSGAGSRVSLTMCWLRDMFSVVTITGEDNVTGLQLTMDNCEVDSVQTCVTCLNTTGSGITLTNNSCNMVLYSEDDPAHVLQVKDGQATIKASNNYICFHHIDGKAFSMEDVCDASIVRNVMTTEEAIDRKLAICEAVQATKVSSLDLKYNWVTGFRLGLNLSSVQSSSVYRCCFDKCSIAMSVPSHNSSSSLKLSLHVSECEVRTTYYGLLLLDNHCPLNLKNSTFIDVPKPILFSKNLKDDISEEDCSYKLSREYTTSKEFKVLEEEMNLHLATSENLPHRAAYDRNDVKLKFSYASLGFA